MQNKNLSWTPMGEHGCLNVCVCLPFIKALSPLDAERILVGSPRWMSPLLTLLSISLMCTQPFQTVDRLQKGVYSRDKFSRSLSSLCR